MLVVRLSIVLALPLAVFAQNRDLLPAGRFNIPGTFVLANVSVIDGTGAPPTRNQTVVVAGGLIQFVGDAASAPIPPGATVSDLRGSTILPGLVMMHEHIYGGDLATRLFLARGVTTVRTAGSFDPTGEINLRLWIKEGRVPGPEFFLSSPVLSERAENLMQYQFIILRNLRDAGDARTVVRHWASEGFDAIKVYRGITAPMLRVVVEEAHRLKLPVLGHIQGVSCIEAAAIGLDSIEHSLDGCLASLREPGEGRLRDASHPGVQSILETLVKSGVLVSVTPVDLRPLSDVELSVLDAGARADYESMVRDNTLGPGQRPQSDDKQGSPGITMAFVRAGGRLVVGADAVGVPRIPGFANVRAVKLLYTAYGFSTLDAIKIATWNGARALGIDKRTGSIAVGKEADLVVVTGDPSKHIKDLENMRMVFSNGVLYDPAALITEMKGKYRRGPGEHRAR